MLEMLHKAQQEQIYYSAITFRRLLDALARPGHSVQLDYPHFLAPSPSYTSHPTGRDVSLNLYALGALLTLLDRETSFLLAANEQWLSTTEEAMRWLALRSGASVGTPDSATFALFCDGQSSKLLSELHQGTLLEPENAATAWYCVERLAHDIEDAEDEEHTTSSWHTLTLSGPGIETTQIIHIAGLSRQTLLSIIDTRQHYPLGLDVYCIDAAGRCIGLPRTTRIHIHDAHIGTDSSRPKREE